MEELLLQVTPMMSISKYGIVIYFSDASLESVFNINKVQLHAFGTVQSKKLGMKLSLSVHCIAVVNEENIYTLDGSVYINVK